MFRKPLFWLALTLLSIGAVLFAFKYFPEAFPIVTLDLQMDRQNALIAAQQLAQKYNWQPVGFKQAASFRLDQEAQNFVELEAGGNEAFRRMLGEKLYSPYTWNVRHFKEGETHEVLIRFTPRGDPYGFVQKLPEKEAGAALAADSARVIAEAAASQDWQIDLSQYQLAEKSQETRPGGRIDHTFVYERPEVKIGEGRYRLRLVVGGDRLTELTHFIKIPEAFSRRYEEMRSANEAINFGAIAVMALLYILGGCGIGIFFLLRQRWVIWRQPLFWGFFIAFLQLLSGINQWPLLWMNYDTALSSQGFAMQQIMLLVAQFMGWGVILSGSFIAAESLSRRAFPQHLQQWRLWSTPVASSKPVLGRTIGGYLLVGLFLAYDVALYFFARRSLGWWTPSDTLVQPNVLATYFPWLDSIAISAQAGFWEESLFRAVPIAGAALIGQKLGMRRVFIAAAMIIQALIFGAGHAGYATQPAYARLVELIIPSLGFGLIYIYFGLLPGIILHFAFDVVWIALPLFVSSASGIWIDRALVVLLALVPLWIILIARSRAGRWIEVSEENYNRAWTPAVKEEAVPVVTEVTAPSTLDAGTVRVLLVGALLGLVVWISTTHFKSVAPPLNTARSEAEALARQTLAEQKIELPAPWRVLSSVHAQPDEDDRFIWQKGGQEIYHQLLGRYLSPPHWKIRFARFEGDVAERAEEYQVFIADKGEIFRVSHKLPEARPGDSLSVEAARKIAHSMITTKYHVDPVSLEEISAVASKRPARQDWTFEFSDTLNYPLKEGEARLAVQIAGNQVVDAHRYIHVPEEWSRAERNRRNLPGIVRILCTVMIVFLIIAGAIGAIVRWSHKKFSVRTFLTFFAVLFGLSLIGVINGWPGMMAQCSTAQPLMPQILILAGSAVIGSGIVSVALALIGGLVQSWRRQQVQIETGRALYWGLALGVFAAGLFAAIAFFAPSLQPHWVKYGAAGNYWPLVEAALDPPGRLILQTTLLLLVFAAVDQFTAGWSRKRVLFSILVILLGLVFTGSRSVETLPFWLISGLLTGVVLLLAHVFVLRNNLALVPVAVSAMIVLSEVKQGLAQPVPAALPGAMIGIILTVLFAVYWHKKLARE
ncbi:MAG: CPBP family intramembrane metalloprotease [candidate division KSB1 bacterium]|nr:CPBP family intramembrane metalloprotease [candidate division KSB1 bacterium]MDZ7305249.1 CPBP family intramembrane metalloprotease [candidate division KSB1 bacterium]MDZ7314375.1 CPBP family intramembrane metalloprotease [candidate division KSB1 bacterium]